MALDIQEITKDSTIKHDRTGHTASRKFRVIADAGETKADVISDSGIPALGDAHPDDALMFVEASVCTEEMHTANADSQQLFYVDVSYTSSFDAIERITPPLSRATDYAYGVENEQQEIYLDYSATPKLVQNSAGDHFENQPQAIVPFMQVTITRNESSFSLLTLYTYSGTVNSNSITINGETIPAAYARMDSISATKETEVISGVTYTYWKVTYVITFNSTNWRAKPFDTGYYSLSSGKRQPIVDKTGLAVQTPWPLDGSGVAKTNSTDTPSVLTFKIYPEVSWSFGF